MKLSTRVRYGARVLCALAASYPGRTVSLAKVARREGISVKYLEQIMIPLRANGLVTASAGARGGYTLARSPSKIRMIEMYCALEGKLELVGCVCQPKVCPRSPGCPTQPLWASINRAVYRELKRTRLSDLVNKKHNG